MKALRYICVDEYQDFSDVFFQLLTAIRKQNPNIELLCASDDGQAINGFAGADLQFSQDFEKYFGESRKLDIFTSYCSSQSIVGFGNALMNRLGQPSIAFPSVASLSGNRLVVRVKSQPNLPFGIGTPAVKDQLKACRYNWHGVNKVWEKSFPVDSFTFDVVCHKVWATAACRVDVSVVDDSETETASYRLDLGAWTCRFDNLGITKEGGIDVRLQAVK